MKTESSTIEARKHRLLELLTEGKSKTEAATILRCEGYPADVRTIQRDIHGNPDTGREGLLQEWREKNMSALEQWRDEHIAELQDLRRKLEDPAIRPAEKVALMLAIIREDSKIKGTAAPSKSISASVNVDAENIGPYRKFVLAVAGLEEVQIEELLLKAREMPRRPFVMVEPPKTSPLWTKNQLTEGDDEVA